MAQIIELSISVGSSIELVQRVPTVTDGTTPVITWEVPQEITQRRYNLRIDAQEDGKIGSYFSGEIISTATNHQFPVGSPMNASFHGLLSIEIAISEDPTIGNVFEFTSGSDLNFYVLDLLREVFYNAANVFMQWKNPTDPDADEQLLYNLLLSKDPTFQNPFQQVLNVEILEDLSSANTNYQTNVETKTTYFWKVRASDSIDFSAYSITNGFVNFLNYPPTVVITAANVLGNEYGDVVIDFTTEDIDVEDIYIKFQYTGGSVEDTKTKISLLSPPIKINNGNHTVIWRSGRDEQLISADDYIIWALPFDAVGPGDEVFYGPLSMDNSGIGKDPGGIGSFDVSFPIISYFTTLGVLTDIDPISTEINGYIDDFSHNLTQTAAINTPIIETWKCFCQGMISNNTSLRTAPGSPNVYDHWWFGSNPKNNIPYDYSHGMLLITNDTAHPEEWDQEGSTIEPNFTPTVDYVTSTGFHKAISEVQWSGAQGRYGYVKFNKVNWRDRPKCSDCDGKGWQQSELIAVTEGEWAGWYQRQPCSGCNGTRFGPLPEPIDPSGYYLSRFSTSYYEPIENWFSPNDQPFMGVGQIIPMNQFVVGFQHIWGRPELKQGVSRFPKTLPEYENFPTTVFQNDAVLLDVEPTENNDFITRGYQPLLEMEIQSIAQINQHDYAESPTFPLRTETMEGRILIRLETPLVANTRQTSLDYKTGFGPDDGAGFGRRTDPTHQYERGVYPIYGNINSIQPLRPLGIIYLQAGWDSANLLHWQATASSVSEVQLQFAKYFEDGTHTEYTDAITSSSVFNPRANAYFVPPEQFHAFWDTVSGQLLDDGFSYRLRIRQFDPIRFVSSQWRYSAKFEIGRSNSNPANIIKTEYEKFSKVLCITFNIFDSQLDYYNITDVHYSVDGITFNRIDAGYIHGQREGLSSNPDIILPDGTPQNQHIISWLTAPYNLDAGDEYRVRIDVLPQWTVDGFSEPYFTWQKPYNPQILQGEHGLIEMEGHLQSYIYDQEDDEFVFVEPPLAIPGKIDLLTKNIEDIHLQPSPSGIYEYFSPSTPSGILYGRTVIDPSGLQTWYVQELAPGLTRSVVLQQKFTELDDIRNILIPQYRGQITESENDIRKNLIDQGFYSNGYVNNSYAQGIFRFRVETMTVGEDAFDSDPETGGEYILDYSDRYEVYHRLQLDFFETFDSQVSGKPLRDILYTKDGSKIQGGEGDRLVLTGPDGEFVLDRNFIDKAFLNFGEGAEAIGQPWEDALRGDQPDGTPLFTEDFETEEEVYENVPGVVYTLPLTELPGEKVNAFINNSYPDWTDTLPSGVATFETDYHVRVASYNSVSSITREQPKVLITNIGVYNDLNQIIVDYTLYGDEDIQTASLNNALQFADPEEHHEYSVSDVPHTWIDKYEIEFLTDRPPEYSTVDQLDSPVLWTPQPSGQSRSRPSSFVTDDHQHFLWYSKDNSFGEPSICFAKSKGMELRTGTLNTENWAYGEHSLCFPSSPTRSLVGYMQEDAAYSPVVIRVNGIFRMFLTICNGGSNRIAYSESSDGSLWTKPVAVSGIDPSSYYPGVLHDGSQYHMWYGKLSPSGTPAPSGTLCPSGAMLPYDVPAIYYATSSDGISFVDENSGDPVIDTQYGVYSPWPIMLDGGYKMYYTKYESESLTKIYSSISTDGISWIGENLEINENNSSNPSVVIDIYKGNQEYQMFYNVYEGQYLRIKTSRLETRSWGHWASRYQDPQTTIVHDHVSGEETNVSCSRFGATHRLTIATNSQGITLPAPAPDDIQLRFDFRNDSTLKDYRMQSAWVNAGNAASLEVQMKPLVFTYNAQIKTLNWGNEF